MQRILTWISENKKSLLLLGLGLVIGYWFNNSSLSFNPLSSINKQTTLPGLSGVMPPAEGIGGAPAPQQNIDSTNPAGGSGSPSDKLIIKTGSLSLVVKDVRIALSNTDNLAASLGGFTSSSDLSIIDQAQNKLTATITIRVPSEKYGSAFDQIKNLAVQVKNESSSGQDVTEQYTDLDSRLRNLQAAEAQLLVILKDAKETKDVLSVFQELTNIRGQIEQIKGQMQYLERSGKLATITIYLATEENELPIVAEKWTPLTPFKEALRSMVLFWQSVASKAIFWGVFVLPFIPIIVIFLLLYRLKKRSEKLKG